MRAIADIATDRIVQVTQTPDDNALTTVNGHYIVPIPEGVSVDITPSSYLTPQDANSIPGLAASGLLARYPMYDFVLFNYFLEAADISAVQYAPGLLPTSPPGFTITKTRYQAGRAVGPDPVGIAPNSMAILPANTYKAASAPGLLQLYYDLAAYIPGGAREFLAWWKISKMSVTEDIVSGYGVTAGANDPAIKSYDEYEQEPADLIVMISNDNGATWTEINRLEPLDIGVTDSDMQIAFINTGSDKIYLTAFAVLFATP